MKVEMTNIEDAVRQDIEAGLPQREVAKTYWFALRSTHPTDWPTVNRMIINRWSVSGLERVKQMAHSGSCWQ